MGDGFEGPVEPSGKPVGTFLATGPEPQCTLDGLQREGVDGADDSRGGNDQGKLAKDLSNDPQQD
jgi:hypothetical protein